MVDGIAVGFQAFVSDGEEEFGAVRAISPDRRHVTVYVENAGDFNVAADAVVKVAFGKVWFDCKKFDGKLCQAIGYAHEVEIY